MKYYSLDDGYKVVLSQPIKGINKTQTSVGKDYETRFGSNIVRKINYDTNRRFDLVHKNIPHALFETMIIDGSDIFHSSIFEYEKNEKKYLSNFVVNMMKTAEDLIEKEYNEVDICLAAGMNFDPLTIDRPSLMTEKRFHFHVMVYTKDLLENATKNYSLTKNINDKLYLNRLLDPISFGTMDLLYQYITEKKPHLTQWLLKPNQKTDVEFGLPIGLKILFKDYNALSEEDTLELLTEIHTLLIEFYWDLYSTVVGTGVVINYLCRSLRQQVALNCMIAVQFHIFVKYTLHYRIKLSVYSTKMWKK